MRHSWAVSTRKGGGFYGYRYRVHAAVCSRTGLPLAWEIATATTHESTFVPPLSTSSRNAASPVETCALDKGYDVTPVYEAREDRDCRLIIPSPTRRPTQGGPQGSGDAQPASVTP